MPLSRNIAFMVMACVLLPACAGDEGKGTTVPTDRIIHPWLSSSPGFNARSGATGSKVTPKEDNRVNEATAAQEPSDGFPLPPADELKGTTVRGNDAASAPAVSPSPGFKAGSGATGSKLTPKEDNRVKEATAAQEASKGFRLSPADGATGPKLTPKEDNKEATAAQKPSNRFRLSPADGATGTKLTPKEDNQVKEATGAQEPSNGFPLSPADELKGTTVRVHGAASLPAVSPSPGFKVADGTVIARDESMKVVRFLGDNLSTVDCLLLTSDLTLRSNGTAAFITNILGVGTALTYHFNFEVYDHRWNLLFTTPNLSHEISSEEYLIDEVNHKITFDISKFSNIEHVNITFQCKRVGSDNPSADARSGATAVIPKDEGNRTQDAAQRLPWTLARTPQPSPPEPSSPKPLAPVVQPVTEEPVGSTTSEPKLININTASADDLNRLGVRFGKAIIAARPYRSVGELVSKRVLKRSTFSRIKDRITATTSQPTAAPTASVLQSLTNAHSARASVLPSSADTPPEPSSLSSSSPVVQPAAVESVGSTTSEPKLIDINTASADDLNRLGVRFGRAIIAARPYRSIGELVSKRVLKRSTFSRIKDRITVAINDAVGATHSDRRSWKQAAPR